MGLWWNPSRAKEDYRDNSEAYCQLLELVVRSVDDAGRRGVRLKTGAYLHLICLGNKGDWPYLVTWSHKFVVYFLFVTPKWASFAINTLMDNVLLFAPVRQPVPTFADRTAMFPKLELPDGHVVEYAIFVWQAAQALTMKMCVWVW